MHYKNKYSIFKNYLDKKNFLNLCLNTIFEELEVISNYQTRKNVEKDGLDFIHKHFPVEYLPFLQFSLEKKLKNILYKQIYKIVKSELKIKKNFLIDKTLNFRFHYPFKLEKKSRLNREVYRCLDLKNYHEPDKEFENAILKSKNYIKDKSDLTKIKYFGNVNASAHHHSPHRDTWFAHSTEGLNFWWAISNVNKQNGLILYQDIYRYNLKHTKQPSYVLDQYKLGKPVVPELNQGDLLLFDPEILHASRINTSNKSRTVFSGRINFGKPKFYKKAYDIKEPYWIKSQDISKDNFTNFQIFLRKNNLSKQKNKKMLKKNTIKSIIINSRLEHGKIYKIKKIDNRFIKHFINEINFTNIKLSFIKQNNKLYVFNTLCPHLKFNLKNGFLSKNKLTCQGHGLEFNLDTGKSLCGGFKIKTYKIIKKDSYYFLKT